MNRIVALMGPTAVGKTDVSIELAKRLDAEIVGCDSMQVYRRMPVLAQQPSSAQLAQVPHHLIGCIEPTEPFSVGEYQRLARETIASIQRRGKTALLVGGTGLYLRALTNGLCRAPSASSSVRQAILRAIEQEGCEAMYQRLQRIDEPAAARIRPHDTRRIVRALEVYELTGKPLSSFWQRPEGGGLSIAVMGIERSREILYDRINRRVWQMLDREQVLEEAVTIAQLPLSDTAQQVHGLRFLLDYAAGTLERDEMVRLWQQQVRQYAKRQMTWFRAEPGVRWLEVAEEEAAGVVADRLARSLEQESWTTTSPRWST